MADAFMETMKKLAKNLSPGQKMLLKFIELKKAGIVRKNKVVLCKVPYCNLAYTVL